jgi:hypothetical protein
MTVLTPDIPVIIDALESTGVYKTVTLLDPVRITEIAVRLAMTYGPNEYRMWLSCYAAANQVESSELAVGVIAILAECGMWWPEIAERCRKQVSQLIPVAAL